VPIRIEHPVADGRLPAADGAELQLFGFILGVWAKGFEQLNAVPMLIVTPLTFLGGAFYSIHMLPEFWRTVSLFNPIVYLISGFRWTFYGQGMCPWASAWRPSRLPRGCLAVVAWMFRTGYRLKN
jgi:ABC-2 type transport system permease protein